MLLGILFLTMQMGVQEARVPFDSTGQVYELGPDVIRGLSWFAEVPDAQKAHLYMLSDSTFVVEIYGRDGLTRQRSPIRPDELTQMRKELAAMPGLKPVRATRLASGRWLYLINSFLFAYGVRGPLVAAALNTQSGEVVAATYLLTASGCFFVPLCATRNEEITYGQVFLSWYGATRGAYLGAMVSSALHRDMTDLSGADALPPLLGSLAMDRWGYSLASRKQYTTGQAAMVTTMGDWGILGTLGTLFLVNVNVNHDEPFPVQLYELAPALVGMPAGMVYGDYLGKRPGIADGDPRIFRGCGYLGGLTAFTVANYFVSDYTDDWGEWNLLLGSAMAGCAAGSYFGYRRIMRTDYSYGNALLVEVGAAAGGMAASAVILLADVDQTDLILTMTTAGMVAGTVLTESSLRANQPKGSRSLGFNPTNLAFAWLAKEKGIPFRMPLISYSF